MSWRMFFRLAIPALLMGALLPVVFAQSQDSQSVAEAARRAKEQKKPPAKPAKVITEDDVKPASPAGATTAATPAAATSAQAAAGANSTAMQTPSDGQKGPEPKEVAALKEQLKQALSDLDLLQRQLRLDQDVVYSKTDYASDKAGIAKVEDEKQQVSGKQQDVDALKAKLADLLKSLGIDASAATTSTSTPPPKP
ncbi:MAG TPA: hypothetical protein VE263_20695 [Candidatus Angelobacter sp.]|nr:hypothetical protein [Candidatus Angelobacter sp.]